MSANDGGSSAETAIAASMKQTIVAHLEVPRLKGTTTKEMNAFLRARDLYEKQIAEKNAQPDVNVPLVTYRAAIDDNFLRLFITFGWVAATNISDITEEDLKACIKNRASRKIKDHELGRVESIVARVKMDTKMPLLEDRVCHLIQHYLQVLDNAGMADLPKEKPHLCIKHIMNCLKPACLHKCMLDIIEWRKDEHFDRKDFNLFVRELSKQAARMDEDGLGGQRQASSSHKNDDGADDGHDTNPERAEKPSRRRRNKNQNSRKPSGGGDGENKGPKNMGGARKKSDRPLPPCLNTRCAAEGGRHYMDECPNTDDAEKERLMKEYRLAKKKRKERFNDGAGSSSNHAKRGGIKALSSNTSQPPESGHRNSALFSASFCDGGVECVVLTDQGSDVNLVPPEIFMQVQQSHPDMQTRRVHPPAKFNSAAVGGVITCDRAFRADIKLRIRHGTTLIIRSVEWLVGDKSDEHAIIGRPLLDAVGCNNQEMLAAAADRNAGVFDAADVANGPQDVAGTIASLLGERNGVFHSAAGEDDDVDSDEQVYIDIGEDDDGEVDNELERRVKEAIRRGLSKRGGERLRKILKANLIVFRVRLGKTPPANVPPMKIDLDPSKPPVQVRARRYSGPQRAFLNKYVQQLVDMGFFVANPNAEWQAAPHIVPKPSSRALFRMKIDLRPVNAATRKRSWPMPYLDSEMQDFRGSKCFLGLDFVSGYWQIPLHPDSQGACGVVTPNGAYSSTRVLQGLTNAAAYFQSNIEPLFGELRDNLKAWLDDFNLHAPDEDTLLTKFARFLEICKERGLYLSAKKCVFFAPEIKWCGRIVSGDGYTMDPSKTEALRDMQKPINAGELCEFVHCMRWMALAIPQFTERVAPLQQMLESAYEKAGRRTKRAIKNIPLSTLSWGTAHDDVFVKLQDCLRHAVKLSYPDPDKVICVHTDASDRFWSGIVSQVAPGELVKSPHEQAHQPLGFVGGEFTKSELNWSTFEKEGYAIFKTFEKLDYLLLGEQPVHVFTDHRNLLYIFAPCALVPASARHVVSKVQRWAMYLSRFEYAIEHIDGSANVFADLLTRWGRGHRVHTTANPRICSLTTATEQLVPAADEILWPTRETLIGAQQRAAHKPTRGTADTDGLVRLDGRIWVPADDTDMKLRILVASHCGSMGHRGATATASVIAEEFVWEGMSLDCRAFVNRCLHCTVSRAGEMVPRPHAHALHGERPNEVIHADYLYMGPSAKKELKYVLIIRDDLSSYVWLWPTASPTSDAAAEAITNWISTFGSFDWLVTDQGTHFTSTLIKELIEETRARHHFTTAYCPWANGTVERVCQEVLRTTTALLLEMRLAPTDWPAVLECVQSVLNQSPLRRLGPRDGAPPGVHRTPLEVFTGMRPTRPLLRALPLGEFQHCTTLDEARARQVMYVESLQQALDNMHRDVTERVTARRKRAIEDHNRHTGVQPVNFSRGDFVLLRRAVDSGQKLNYRWVGPRRVFSETSPLVFEIEDINSGDVEKAHARRLMLYRNDVEGKSVDPRLLSVAEHSTMTYQVAVAIRAIREVGGETQLQVEWEGLPDREDMSWEPLAQAHEDLPGMVEDFLQTAGERAMKRRALARLN